MFECEERIELDQAMEIAKDDRNGQVNDVPWVFAEEPHKLHHFGEAEHEDDLGSQESVAVGGRPLRRRSPARVDKEGVEDKGQGGKGGDVEGVSAPRLLTVEMG